MCAVLRTVPSKGLELAAYDTLKQAMRRVRGSNGEPKLPEAVIGGVAGGLAGKCGMWEGGVTAWTVLVGWAGKQFVGVVSSWQAVESRWDTYGLAGWVVASWQPERKHELGMWREGSPQFGHGRGCTEQGIQARLPSLSASAAGRALSPPFPVFSVQGRFAWHVGILSTIATYPMETVRTRMAVAAGNGGAGAAAHYSSVLDCVLTMAGREGVGSLWKVRCWVGIAGVCGLASDACFQFSG